MLITVSPAGHRTSRCNSGSPAVAAVAFAASTGGLVPLIQILRALPQSFEAAILVAVHAGPNSILDDVLRPRCRMSVTLLQKREVMRNGVIYVPPPLHHVVVNPDRTVSAVGRDRLDFVRPSADWLFHSVAATYGHAAVAVVLSGARRDGARGAVSVQRAGGAVFVQHPHTCLAPDMPMAAILSRAATAVLRPDEIADAVTSKVSGLDVEHEHRLFDDPFAA